MKHDVNSPVSNPAAWQWHATSDAEFEKIRVVAGESNAIYRDDSLPVLRGQYWIDLLDSHLRVRYPHDLKWVPKPRMKLFKTEEVNAYVNRVVVCLPVRSAVFATSTAAPADTVFIEPNGTYTRLEKDACLAQMEAIDLPSVLAMLNQNRAGCKIVSAGSGLSFTEECGPTVAGGEILKADRVAIALTSNILSVFSGLYSAAQKEEDMVAVLYHELGHYYRSHITAPDTLLGYFYANKGNINRPYKPIPDASLDAIGKRLAKYSNLGRFSAIQNQKVRSEMFSWMRMKLFPRIKAACAAGSKCAHSCSAWLSIMEDPGFKAQLKGFPGRALTSTKAALYRVYEDALHTCAKNVVFSDLDPVAAAEINQAFKDFLISDYQVLDLTVLPKFVSLDAEIKFANLLFEKRDAAVAEAKQAAAKVNLGFYTFEQEADEISAEWLALVGLHSRSAIDAQFMFGKDMEKTGGNSLASEISMSECSSLLAAGWARNPGSRTFIPLGSLADPHHGTCYRIYNLDRDIRAHTYVTAPAPQKPSPSWLNIVQGL